MAAADLESRDDLLHQWYNTPLRSESEDEDGFELLELVQEIDEPRSAAFLRQLDQVERDLVPRLPPSSSPRACPRLPGALRWRDGAYMGSSD